MTDINLSGSVHSNSNVRVVFDCGSELSIRLDVKKPKIETLTRLLCELNKAGAVSDNNIAKGLLLDYDVTSIERIKCKVLNKIDNELDHM